VLLFKQTDVLPRAAEYKKRRRFLNAASGDLFITHDNKAILHTVYGIKQSRYCCKLCVVLF